MRRSLMIGILVLAAACGYDSTPTYVPPPAPAPPPPPPPSVDVGVSIIDLAYQPASVTVSVGGTVTWTNNGASVHTVTSNNGLFDSGNLAPATATGHGST